MKKIQFNIMLSNYSEFALASLDGRTAFPTTGYVVVSDAHPDRLLAVSRTIRIGKRGFRAHPKLWAVYDVASGFRVPHSREDKLLQTTRDGAIGVAMQRLREYPPEKLQEYFRTKAAKLAVHLLEK